eukprot:449815_1
MAVGIVYVLVLLWIPLFAVLPPSPPVFSWDTLPLFVHVANQGGPLSTTQAQFMASFPLATIDKKQDVAKNKTSCTLGINCEEDKIIDALKQIRSYNNSVRTIFYLNTILNFPQYNLSSLFFENNASLLVHDRFGNLVWDSGCGGGEGKKNTTIFDLAQPLAQTYWLNTIKYALTKYPNVVDGAFGDRANGNLKQAVPCYNFTSEHVNKWNDGHYQLMQETMELILSINPERGIFITNNMEINGTNARMYENFDGTQVVDLLNDAMQNERIIEVHDYPQQHSLNQTVTAFLISAYDHSYYASTNGWTTTNGWKHVYPEYINPLGAPLGNATLNKYNNITAYYREFEHGVSVWLEQNGKHPCIKWNATYFTGKIEDCRLYNSSISKS